MSGALESAESSEPLIREGDHLNAEQFLARWERMPGVRHLELIGGVVFAMPSPISILHDSVCTEVLFWLRLYCEATPGCRAGGAATWEMTPADVPQPDAWLQVLPCFRGQAWEIGAYHAGAPELIVEVTLSTYSRDLGIKQDLYQRAGVKEYITVLPEKRDFQWRVATPGGTSWRQLAPEPDGFWKSIHFPGLWLEPESLWDTGRPLRPALDAGLASPEHQAFVSRLDQSK